jgi:hypothetical protein
MGRNSGIISEKDRADGSTTLPLCGNRKMNSSSIDQHLEELLQTVKAARANYDIWWAYKKDRPKYVDVLNEYLEFFRVSIHAHFVAMLMALYKLYDKRSDSIGVDALIEEALADAEFTKDDSEKIARYLDLAKPISEKVKVLRHKLFAHRDRKFDYDDTFSAVQIKYDDFRDLTEYTINILNIVLYSRKKTTWRFENCHRMDAYRVLDALRSLQKKHT